MAVGQRCNVMMEGNQGDLALCASCSRQFGVESGDGNVVDRISPQIDFANFENSSRRKRSIERNRGVSANIDEKIAVWERLDTLKVIEVWLPGSA